MVPLLRPRIKSSAISKALVELESSSKDDYHEWINWLDRHRFYLDKGQCACINAALDRIGREPREVGEIQLIRDDFVPDPDFNATYLEADDAP